MNAALPFPRHLTVEEVADVYRRPVSFVEAWIRSGRLPAMRLSPRTVRVAWADVVAQYCGMPQVDLEHPDAVERVEREWTPPSREPHSFVYFIEAAGLIKIGFSKQPEKRLAAIRSMSAAPVEVLAIVGGSAPQERALHKCFAAERQRGEWFEPSDRLRRYVKSCQTLGRLPQRRPGPPA